MQKKVLFLGGVFPKERYSQYTDPSVNKSIQNAADVLQWHIIRGMEKNLDQPIEIINAPYIGTFPRSCKIVYSKKYHFKHRDDSTDINIGFLNLPFWRHISIYLHSRPHLKRWAKENNDGVAIAYALTLRNIYRLLYIKKTNASIKTCVVVPDLPMYMRMSQSRIYTFMKSIEIKLIKRKLPMIDGYVLLTEAMNEFVSARQFCVMEGIATESALPAYEHTEQKSIFYAGTLEHKYGVMNLVKAFEQIQGDAYRLYICGKGGAEKEIELAAQRDPRICYLGQISRDEVLAYQKCATVLVNPRQNTQAFTKYSFPSKNLEYLSSGIPFIAYKLDGIPDEYDNYILYVKNNTVEALRDKIVEVCEYSDDERKRIGLSAREFVLREKCEQAQAARIVNMIMKL